MNALPDHNPNPPWHRCKDGITIYTSGFTKIFTAVLAKHRDLFWVSSHGLYDLAFIQGFSNSKIGSSITLMHPQVNYPDKKKISTSGDAYFISTYSINSFCSF